MKRKVPGLFKARKRGQENESFLGKDSQEQQESGAGDREAAGEWLKVGEELLRG